MRLFYVYGTPFLFRDYTNPSLPVNPSAIDVTGQVNADKQPTVSI